MHLDLNLSRLMAWNNEVDLGSFVMVDAIEPVPESQPYTVPSAHTWRERMASFGAFAFVLYLFCALIVGTGVIVTFLLRLFF